MADRMCLGWEKPHPPNCRRVRHPVLPIVKFGMDWGYWAAGLAIMAQAMRGGAALLASAATAWIAMAGPPFLDTEWASDPSVTFGAMTLACAVPSAPTMSEKAGMS